MNFVNKTIDKFFDREFKVFEIVVMLLFCFGMTAFVSSVTGYSLFFEVGIILVSIGIYGMVRKMIRRDKLKEDGHKSNICG